METATNLSLESSKSDNLEKKALVCIKESDSLPPAPLFKTSIRVQNILLWLNRFWTLINFVVILGLSIAFAVLTPAQFGKTFFAWASPDSYVPLRIVSLTIGFVSLLGGTLALISAFKVDYKAYHQYKLQFIALSMVSLNLFSFGQNCFVFIWDRKLNSDWEKQKFWKRFWRWKKQHLTIRDITLIGLFTALTVLFSFLEGIILIPFLPAGGSPTLKYLIVMIISFFHSFWAGFLVGSISALLSLLVVPASLIISPWSYLLDYFLPMISPALTAFMVFEIKNKSNYLQYVNYLLLVFINFCLICFWQTLSGYFIWVKLYGPSWGSNGLVYALLANITVSFGLNYPLTQLLVPPIFRVLKNFPWRSN